MTPNAWATIGAVVGPLLLFLTYVLSRQQAGKTFMADIMSTQVNSALATTETMKMLLEPLEAEISDMRDEIVSLREHITMLEDQIKTLGHKPIEFFPYGRQK